MPCTCHLIFYNIILSWKIFDSDWLRDVWWKSISPAESWNYSRTVNIYILYHGYCKDQKNIAVIILEYTTLRHNGLWNVIHTPFFTIKKYPWISNLEELCSIHLFDLVLTLYISDRTCDKNLFLGGALLFKLPPPPV